MFNIQSVLTGKVLASNVALFRCLALSGALAIGLSAYGAHGFKPENKTFKDVFQSANHHHLLHSVALLATPLTPRPRLFACCLGGGIILFSGSCYIVALMENRRYGQLAPFGGLLFIAGWLSLFV